MKFGVKKGMVNAAVVCWSVLMLGDLLHLSGSVRGADETRRCIKWRATANCDPIGARVSSKDAACEATIKSGQSGFCECENGRRVREVGCDHHSFTCKEACHQHASAEMELPEGYEYVTCGSVIKLVHDITRFRLHSHEIGYGGGSGQQSVTAHGSRNDPSSYWLVKESHDANSPCKLGEKISCGSKLRLEHIHTRKNLHSHNFVSPVSRNSEVSAFGVAGEGDLGDTWEVQCDGSQQCSAAKGECPTSTMWLRDSLIRLKHGISGKFLQTAVKNRFDDSNCRGCPINGQLEVSATPSKVDESLWFASEGIYASLPV